MRKLFEELTTLEELKALYKKLAMENHPDRGGDNETMKEINGLYEEYFKNLKDTHKTKDGKTYTKETKEAPEEFINIINKLLKMDGVIVEVIGCFIWLSGNTKEHKDEIKKLGFKYSEKKQKWYKSPTGYKKRTKKNYSMDEIRSFYGSKTYEAEKEENKKLTS